MNAVISFLGAHFDTLVTLATIVGGYLYHTIRGDGRDSARSILQSLAITVAHDPTLKLDDVATRMAAVAKARLLSLGFSGPVADTLISEAVAIAVAEARKRLTAIEDSKK